MDKENLLTINELAFLLNCSIQSINNWYRFKRQNPENEYAKILPEPTQSSERRTRYWKRSDVELLMKFQKSIPRGCNGIMGSVTQWHKRKEIKNG